MKIFLCVLTLLCQPFVYRTALAEDLYKLISGNKVDEVRAVLEREPTLLEAYVGEQDREERPLQYAVTIGHEPMVRLLLESGANVDTRNIINQTPLHTAASLRRLEIVKILLAHGADANASADAVDQDGKTPMNYAAQSGSAEILESLLEHGGRPATADLESVGFTGCVECARLLMEHGVDVNKGAALMNAVSHGKEALAFFLLDHGAKPDPRPDSTYSAVGFAAKTGSLKLLKKLVKNGGHVDSGHAMAFASNSLEKTEFLLSRGASVHGTIRGWPTPLCEAAEFGIVAVGELLIAGGADVHRPAIGIDKEDYRDRDPPLAYAVRYARTNFCRLLLQHGAVLNLPTAVAIGDLEFMRAQPQVDMIDASLVEISIIHRQDEALQVLMELGNDPDAGTPLIMAVSYRDVDATRILLEHGANPNIKMETSFGPPPTPLEIVDGDAGYRGLQRLDYAYGRFGWQNRFPSQQELTTMSAGIALLLLEHGATDSLSKETQKLFAAGNPDRWKKMQAVIRQQARDQ